MTKTKKNKSCKVIGFDGPEQFIEYSQLTPSAAKQLCDWWNEHCSSTQYFVWTQPW